MTDSRYMLDTLTRGAAFLGAMAHDIAAYVQSQVNPDGGCAGRDTRSDLYYTTFALDCLLACGQTPWPALTDYLAPFGAGERLDFMHTICLARCRTRMPEHPFSPAQQSAWLNHIEQYRSRDGGYHTRPGSETGSITAAFLALTCLADFQHQPDDPQRIADSIETLRTHDGAYANERGMQSGTTLATAGALILHTQLARPAPTGLEAWLLARQHPAGGFLSSPDAPVPDLLSTATALYALKITGFDLAKLRSATLDFADGLWHESGGYCGYWTDHLPDCEYTYYGLLAMGCVAES